MAKSIHSVTTPDITTRLATTGQLLVRSGIEINRILGAMVDDGATVSASLASKVLFLSRLLRADPVKQHLLVAYSDHKAANTALLAAASVTFRCNHRGAQFAFSCGSPRLTMHERQPAIQVSMPTAMLGVQHRRAPQRMQVPAQAHVDCQLRMGTVAFSARLVDMSLGGMGFLLCEDVVPLCAGTRLDGVRIGHPEREPLLVDVEVRHVHSVALADGRRATRIGCRILGAPKDLEELIRLFIIDLQ